MLLTQHIGVESFSFHFFCFILSSLYHPCVHTLYTLSLSLRVVWMLFDVSVLVVAFKPSLEVWRKKFFFIYHHHCSCCYCCCSVFYIRFWYSDNVVSFFFSSLHWIFSKRIFFFMILMLSACLYAFDWQCLFRLPCSAVYVCQCMSMSVKKVKH